jgi:hypothetical protein
MNTIRLIAVICCILLSACSSQWEGFVYPNKSDLTNHIGIGSYRSLEDCRSSALSALAKVSSQERGDYECGLNCKLDGGTDGMKVCEDTRK